jgi:hypothetical protein
MTTKDSSKSTMDKIMSGQVKQVPRWHFVVRNIILWTLGILCILAGALTVSLIIFTFANSALAMSGIAYQSFWQHTIVFVPLLWILGTLLFVGLFKLSVRHTNMGYKYSLISILLVSLIASIITGIGFYFIGVSHIIDDVLGSHFRAYHSVEKRQAQIFDNPERGIIIGNVIEVQEEHFVLVTPQGKQWVIINEQIPEVKKKFIAEGERFVILGKKVNDDIFIGCDLRNRKMAGASKQLQRQHMQQMKHKNCSGNTCVMHKHTNISPKNINVLVEKACTQK